jgi:hypothetical protein
MVDQNSRECYRLLPDGIAKQRRYPCVIPTEDSDDLGVWMSWTWQRRGVMSAKIVLAS